MDKIYCGDSLQVLQTLPENAVDCCVTSPPYYALRDYGADGQIGREATPEEYVSLITACLLYTSTCQKRTGIPLERTGQPDRPGKQVVSPQPEQGRLSH